MTSVPLILFVAFAAVLCIGLLSVGSPAALAVAMQAAVVVFAFRGPRKRS